MCVMSILFQDLEEVETKYPQEEKGAEDDHAVSV